MFPNVSIITTYDFVIFLLSNRVHLLSSSFSLAHFYNRHTEAMTNPQTPKFVSIVTQKGGAGKSTLTLLYASYLYYELGRDVIILDCDYPQHSIADRRLADQNILEESPEARQEFEAQGKELLPILKVPLSDAPQAIQRLKSTVSNSIIFLDLPGTMNQPGYAATIAQLDVAIIPIEVDDLSFSSALMTIEVFAKISEKTGRSFPMHVLWNRVNMSEKKEKLEALEEYIGTFTSEKKIPVQVLDTKVRQLVGWKNNRSTIKAYSQVDEILSELLTKQIL